MKQPYCVGFVRQSPTVLIVPISFSTARYFHYIWDYKLLYRSQLDAFIHPVQTTSNTPTSPQDFTKEFTHTLCFSTVSHDWPHAAKHTLWCLSNPCFISYLVTLQPCNCNNKHESHGVYIGLQTQLHPHFFFVIFFFYFIIVSMKIKKQLLIICIYLM